MKRTLLLVAIACFVWQLNGQNYQAAPEGFDQIRQGIVHGRIDTVVYNSSTVGNQRRALVYTPPGFSKNKKYPVLYLLHGIGGDEKEWFRQGNPQAILDNLYADKKAEPMIVVLPNGRAMGLKSSSRNENTRTENTKNTGDRYIRHSAANSRI
jgi:enterochelin esterase-like enzyme